MVAVFGDKVERSGESGADSPECASVCRIRKREQKARNSKSEKSSCRRKRQRSWEKEEEMKVRMSWKRAALSHAKSIFREKLGIAIPFGDMPPGN